MKNKPVPGNEEISKAFEKHYAFQRKSRLEKAISCPGVAGVRVLSRGLKALNVSLPWRAKTFYGDTIRVILPEYNGETLALYGFTEPEVVIYMLRSLRAGDTVFDIGAHYGSYSLLASRLVGESGSVHAFEPTPRTFKVLEENARGLRNITVNNNAVWNKSGRIEFYDLGANASGGNTIKIRPVHKSFSRGDAVAVTIDEYCRDGIAPDFVKIDAEQAEREILDGGKKTIDAHRPVVSVEIWNDSETRRYSESVKDFFRSRRYLMFVWDGESLRPAAETIPSVMNYLFVPREKAVLYD